MATLIPIAEPRPTHSFALFELAFRPFFLLGAVFALFAALPWMLNLHGMVFNPHINAMWWHSHEMIFGFALAIIMGFLLTAAQNWTGVPSPRDVPLMVLVGLWLLPRLFLPFAHSLPIGVLMASDVLAGAGVALVLARMVFKAKQWRNLPFALMVGMLTVLNGLSYWTASHDNMLGAMRIHEAALLWVALVMNMLGGRVIPFFTERASSYTRQNEPKWLLSVSNIALILTSVTMLLDNDVALRISAAASALIVFYRWNHWGWRASFHNPLLWSLHLSFACLPLACALLAFGYPRSGALHLFTIGAMTGLIVSMMSRVSLGHTGRELKVARPLPWAYGLLFIAGLARASAAIWPQMYLPLLDITLTCWMLALGIFVYYYAGVLLRPRVDGRRG